MKTLRYCYDQRTFTAQWYDPLCRLADEAGVEHPPVSMFGWRSLNPAPSGEAA